VAVIHVCLALLNILGEQQIQIHNYLMNCKFSWSWSIERNISQLQATWEKVNETENVIYINILGENKIVK